MKQGRWVWVLILAVALAGPALAGEKKHDCTASTQDCLNKMAASMKTKGFIGVDGEWCDLSNGFRVESYIPGMNAQQAGIEIGPRDLESKSVMTKLRLAETDERGKPLMPSTGCSPAA